MEAAQNDSDFYPGSVAHALVGFEVAVADYERRQCDLDEAHYHLKRITSQLDYARICMEETEAQLAVVVMQVNSSDPGSSDHNALVVELDKVNDAMVKNVARYEVALARHQFAMQKFESERASIRETRDIATALRGELSRSLQDGSLQQACNDPEFHPQDTLNKLSDAAYRYFRLSA